MSIRPQSSWELMNYIWIDSTEFNTIFYSLHYFLTCQCTTTVFNNIHLGPPWDYADLPAAMWLLFAGLDMWLIKSDNCAFTQQSTIAAIHWYRSHFLLVLEIQVSQVQTDSEGLVLVLFEVFKILIWCCVKQKSGPRRPWQRQGQDLKEIREEVERSDSSICSVWPNSMNRILC